MKIGNFLMKTVFLICLLFSSVQGIILAKSKLSVCENTGVDGSDPYNIVEGKKCEKKLIITLSVTNGQNATEMIYANISKVRDETSNENARLYNPFIITISKSPVTLIYPYYYTGYVVNNKPYEEIRRKGSRWNPESRTDCSDVWEADEDDSTCGFAYKDKRSKLGSSSKDGTKVWDSQGFCCYCSERDKWRSSFGYDMPYFRGGMTCGLFKNHQASGHCMKYDKLWYTVHEIGLWQMDFTVHVKALDQVTKIINNKTIIDYVDGGEIVLGPKRRSGTGLHNRIVAHFIGEFQATKQFPVLSERYLLIPEPSPDINPKTHKQFKDGPMKYLIMPRDLVDLHGHTCNKIGVTFTAFRNQATDGFGFGCRQKQGYCLYNQPLDFWEEDNDKIRKGKQPSYFPSRYGKLVGVNKQVGHKQFALAFETDQIMTSMLNLQISADDIILVYNRATGEIVSAAVMDFQAVSTNGKLYVDVMNTGYVTADFYVTVPDCSAGMGAIHEKGSSINPQLTKTFGFPLNAYKREGSTHFCVVQLFDSQRKLLDSRNVTFKTFTPCTCIPGCRCTCDQEELDCKNPEDEGVIIFEDPSLSMGGWLDTVFDFVESVVTFPFKMFDAFDKYKYVAMAIAALLAIGLVKAIVFSRGNMAVARFGMGLLFGSKKSEPETKIIYKMDEKGETKSTENEGSNGHSNHSEDPQSPILVFFYNVFFFVLLPFMLLINLCLLIVRKIKENYPNKRNIENQSEDEKDKQSNGSITQSEGEEIILSKMQKEASKKTVGNKKHTDVVLTKKKEEIEKNSSPSKKTASPKQKSKDKKNPKKGKKETDKVKTNKKHNPRRENAAKEPSVNTKMDTPRSAEVVHSVNTNAINYQPYKDHPTLEYRNNSNRSPTKETQRSQQSHVNALGDTAEVTQSWDSHSQPEIPYQDHDERLLSADQLDGHSTPVIINETETDFLDTQGRLSSSGSLQDEQQDSDNNSFIINVEALAAQQTAYRHMQNSGQNLVNYAENQSTAPDIQIDQTSSTMHADNQSHNDNIVGHDLNLLNTAAEGNNIETASFHSACDEFDEDTDEPATGDMASESTATVMETASLEINIPSALTEDDIVDVIKLKKICYLNLNEPSERLVNSLEDPGPQFSLQGKLTARRQEKDSYSFEVNPVAQVFKVSSAGFSMALQRPHPIPWNLLRKKLTKDEVLLSVTLEARLPCLNSTV